MKRSQISVLSRGSTGSCVVCGRREGTNALSEVRLFAFPLCEQRKSLWLQRCHLESSDISARAKICNHHFVSGAPLRNKCETDYAPSLNLTNPPVIKNQQNSSKQSARKSARTTSSASSANVRSATRNETSEDDDFENEDEHCFEEVCEREQCQQQATKLVELLVKVGTLERTIRFLEHDLKDKANEIAKLKAQLERIPVTRIRAKAESQQRIIPRQRNESDLRKKSSTLERKPRKTRRSPHESYPSLKLRIRTSRIRYVESTSSDECRPEYSNELRGGNFPDDEAARIVGEVVRGLVEGAVRRS